MFKKNNTFCINLDRRQDRLETFTNEINRIGGEFTRWSAIDGKELEPINQLTKEQYGIFKSHLSLWRHILTLNLNEVIIFEDDCIFVDDFLIRFENFINEIPKSWRVIKLGLYPYPEINHINPISVNVGILNSYSWGSHAYMFKRSAIEFLVNLFDNNNKTMTAVDYYIFNCDCNIFCPVKNLCLQSGSIGDCPISDQHEYFLKIKEEIVSSNKRKYLEN